MDGIILVNKPVGITSHDLVQKARRKLQTKKIGHTGTLDPLANGLMILTVGKATKILPFLSHHFKEYICTMKLGLKSDTLDCTGEISEERAITPVNENDVVAALNSLLGKSMQVPPMYSAKKVNGQHLYDLARNNQEIEREACPIEISDIELLSFDGENIKFRVSCSTGTYVRVLTQDIAEKLGNIAVMTELTRTKIDRFSLDNAYDIEQLNPENINLISNYEILSDYTYISLNDPTMAYLGKRMKFNCTDKIVMVTHQNDVVAAYELDENDGYYYSKRGLW